MLRPRGIGRSSHVSTAFTLLLATPHHQLGVSPPGAGDVVRPQPSASAASLAQPNASPCSLVSRASRNSHDPEPTRSSMALNSATAAGDAGLCRRCACRDLVTRVPTAAVATQRLPLARLRTVVVLANRSVTCTKARLKSTKY